MGFSAKGKGKDHETRSPKTMKGKVPSASVGAGSGLATTREPPSVVSTGSRVTRQSMSRASLPEMSSPTPSGPVQHEKESPAAGKVRLDATTDVYVPPRKKRRKTDINTSVDLVVPPVPSPTKTSRSRALRSMPTSSKGKTTLNGVHLTPAAKLSPQLLADNVVPPVRTPPIRRIKLIVRAPEPIYTNPKHRPAPSIFNKSVMSTLASYTRLENDDVSAIALEDAARERAVLLERVYAMRQQGRMLLSAEDASRALQTRPTDPRTVGEDPWDRVLDAVCGRYRQRETSGQEIAATIAAKVRTYWDTQNAKEGKVKLQQEKQLRALAKATLKLVIAEWKKAVFVSEFFSARWI